jgi:molecular chaperone HtpG
LTRRFQINLRGIIDLLSSHLYSRPEVCVRELLQNGVDAITARQQLTPEHAGEITLAITTPRGKPPTLEVADNGIGLTEDEIHRFLATVGETSKRIALLAWRLPIAATTLELFPTNPKTGGGIAPPISH